MPTLLVCFIARGLKGQQKGGATVSRTKRMSYVDMFPIKQWIVFQGRVSFYFGQAQLDQAYEAEGF